MIFIIQRLETENQKRNIFDKENSLNNNKQLLNELKYENNPNKTKEEFKKKIESPWQALDEMRSVRLVKLKNRKPKISEFVGRQIDIFDSFGFEIPKGCAPASKRQKTVK